LFKQYLKTFWSCGRKLSANTDVPGASTNFGGKLVCQGQPTEKRAGSRSASFRADYPRLGILHAPPCFIPRCVLVAIPRGPAYMKIGVRRSSKHDPRARISHRSREAAMRRIKRPKHHPVWPYGNWRACLIEGRVVAMLRGPAKHITQSR
jgi:hypothetical protein